MNPARFLSRHPLRRVLPLAIVFTLAGCGTVPYEVVTYPNGRTRAPSTADAVGYCQQKGQTAQVLERAPGETGVMFRCS